MAVIVNIDGKIFNQKEAKISVFDRGFLYGDSVYEVIRSYGSIPFACKEHFNRLQRSADMLKIPIPVSLLKIESEMRQLIKEAGNKDSYVRIIVTRGEGEITLDPAMAESPHYVIIVKEFQPPPKHLYNEGASVMLVKSGRLTESALPPGSKTGNYLINLMALAKAREKGNSEAILLDGKGRVTEGTTCNIFMVRSNTVITPSVESGILAGITRSIIINLCRRWGIKVKEQNIYPQDLKEADEVFITSTIRDVMPVTMVDSIPIKDGRPGQITETLRRAYLEYVREYIEKNS